MLLTVIVVIITNTIASNDFVLIYIQKLPMKIHSSYVLLLPPEYLSQYNAFGSD